MARLAGALAAGLTVLACATGQAQPPPRAPEPPSDPEELLDCSYEYGALDTAGSYVRAFNDVARSYLAAQRLHAARRSDPTLSEEEVEEAWSSQVGAAQTLLRACRCWEQLDRVGFPEQVLAAEQKGTKRLKAEIGETVAGPCAKVFEAEAAGR